MSSPVPIVSRTWHAVAPEGRSEGLVTLGVGAPALRPGGEWSVIISLTPIEPERTISGVDGWQAMALGMRFVADRVAHLSEQGWKFFWSEGGDPATAQDIEGGRDAL